MLASSSRRALVTPKRLSSKGSISTSKRLRITRKARAGHIIFKYILVFCLW
jgi:hypothetical protein